MPLWNNLPGPRRDKRKIMLLRNVLLFAFCVIVAFGISHVYTTHASVVWGLLAFCWVSYLLKRRATALFEDRSTVRVPVSSRRRNS